MSRSKFWNERAAAAYLKHKLLGGYLPVFIGKAGKFAAGRRVAFVDAFAGEGLYSDGTPGSAVLIAQLATGIKDRGFDRNLVCHFIEKRPRACAKLEAALAGFPIEYTIHCGDAELIVPGVLKKLGGAPAFVFVDPYGLKGMPFDFVVDILKRPGAVGGGKTEVLINFSRWAVTRPRGLARKELEEGLSDRERKALVTIDCSLGGEWWRHKEMLDKDEQQILIEYTRLLREASGLDWARYALPVRDRIGGPVEYFLAFFTQHPDGLWEFAMTLSSAREAWSAQFGQGDLFHGDEETELVGAVTKGLRAALVAGKPITVQRAFFSDACAPVVGRARQKHIGKAIRQLIADGELAGDAPKVRDQQKFVLRRPG